MSRKRKVHLLEGYKLRTPQDAQELLGLVVGGVATGTMSLALLSMVTDAVKTWLACWEASKPAAPKAK